MKNVRRVVHTVFAKEIPPEFAKLALKLANDFIDFLTSQTDVYVRHGPIIETFENITMLRFRLGLDRNPEQQFPGKKWDSNTAYEELASFS